MCQLSSVFKALVCLTPLLASAVPLESRPNPAYVRPTRFMAGLPDNTTMLSLDPSTGALTAYDVNHRVVKTIYNATGLTVRQSTASACNAMASGNIQKLPGWSALLSVAQSMWGTGSFNSATKSVCGDSIRVHEINTLNSNPSYPQYPASICTDLATVTVTPNENPQCTVQDSTTGGTLVGAGGTVTLTSIQGTSYSTTTTVTQSAALAVGDTFGVSVEIPGVEVSDSVTVTTTFTNTLSTASTSTVNLQTSQSITLNAPIDSVCSLSFTTTSCTTSGTGTVTEAATGWAWFDFNSETDGHYLWALLMDYYLTLEQRSSYINFRAAVNSDTLSQYTGSCTLL
ncbi:hypothetical protein DFH07DRAFT_769313 [Mycena maculata]|uniref:Uncharacterized protein n=1 Tax=Mycena maculata TaxID=230809 RepID=A0AAD7NN43_9AGAR|nr:hypothetical protein DFH07DRAFT_769313 [Mycena maculata]